MEDLMPFCMYIFNLQLCGSVPIDIIFYCVCNIKRTT